MMTILKASAGSGKTFNLALEYIRILVASEDPISYRHILAVTFTNKATEEMKGRILKELHTLATDPGKSQYRDKLVPETVPDVATLQKRARERLGAILHDYGAFSVSTIDKFFQQALRAFSHEIGQFASYQVDLDRKALVAETVERILDSLTPEDTRLVEWLSESMKTDLESGLKPNLEEQLTKMATRLKSEDHEAAVLRWGIDEDAAYDREHLKAVYKGCRKVENDFREAVEKAAGAVMAVIDSEGVSPQDFYSSFIHKVVPSYENLDPKDRIKPPTPAFLQRAADPSQWFKKTTAHLQAQLEGVLEPPLSAFCDLFGQPYRVYRTASLIRKQVFALGIDGELRKAFLDIQKEKNVISIDDSNTILRDIIDSSDAPFVYERLGVRYENFLLDEFQDTSVIQWDNFRPLLSNSESGGFRNLAVGDVKQSIYRFRGSDWRLLKDRLPGEFPETKVRTLDENYRTLKGIVAFNNAFFPFAAASVDSMLGGTEVSDLYADVRQKAKYKGKGEGMVEVAFTPDQPGEILHTIQGALDDGLLYGDMAILVRNNKEGALAAASLVANHIPVISDDSLYVKASVTVRRLVSQMSLADASREDRSVAGFLAGSMGLEIPGSYNTLMDLAEQMLRGLQQSDPETCQAEVPYIQAFMDYLHDWCTEGGNNIAAFLRDWEADSPKIASPREGNSVRIITIHKAKGLEFPLVIFPYAEKVDLYKIENRWCRPAADGTPLENITDGVYDIALSRTSEATLFQEDFLRERRLQAIDNLNLFYVALTRPKCGLKIIATLPPKVLKDDPEGGSWSNLSQVLYTWLVTRAGKDGAPAMASSEDGDTLRFRSGSMQGFTREADKDGSVFLQVGYPSFAPEDENGRSRLRISAEAADYFGPGGEIGPHASARLRGIVLHDILSRVETPEDLSASVETKVLTGNLPEADRASVEAFLAGKIRSVEGEGWFSGEGKVLNEITLIDTDGSVHRPDRVVVTPAGGALVIDYKFPGEGEIPPSQAASYRRQVGRYMRLLGEMGYAPVSGCVWYLRESQDVIDRVLPLS